MVGLVLDEPKCTGIQYRCEVCSYSLSSLLRPQSCLVEDGGSYDDIASLTNPGNDVVTSGQEGNNTEITLPRTKETPGRRGRCGDRRYR